MTTRPKQWRVGVEYARDWLRITVCGVTHLRFRRHELVGLQSWTLNGAWWLEITLHDGVLTAEYSTRGQLEDILAAIEGHL